MKLLGIGKYVAGLILAAPVFGVQAQTVLQLNNWLPPSHFVITDVIKPWADDIAAATEGRVRIQVTTSSLGPPARQFDLARQGVADITWSTQGYTPGRFPSSESVELPFLSNTAEALSVAYWRTHNAFFGKLNEYAGVKLLSLHVQPPGELFTKDKVINSLDDLKNLKIRVVGPITSDLMKQGGGVAVAAPVSQIFELVSSGVVDGSFLTTDSIPQMKMTDYLHHRTTVDGGFYNASFFLVMNQKSWDRLSSQDQQAITALSGEAFAKRMGKVWDEKRAYGIKQFEEHGGQHIQIQGAALEKLKAKMEGARTKWIATMAERGVDGEAALKMVREEVGRYKAN
ncbi:TRAP transporter substrate-binding protein [Eoetvoesiella caeni]|uniref:TRAP-type C4-dicarboxylate transport system substrate-binding protein n=1 Tax=Eoetvoesiella caeni TaxID=645616 RepID=A0A366H261_9BURK|nr:TRAP transporter substrate-binding protein [Eoetvoesiella caeni]MCI2808314.1 TRAP transporter substrate-binding protein [Eoetvoesiella caeni]NYT53684.1 TRAP transporter substrate-binding protein [Eoetvoesiella caeni]RBP35982.1 TRAP-type C4-dicarboxylate transport system substrate-binding protein [Eoetvoesiella caeni]